MIVQFVLVKFNDDHEEVRSSQAIEEGDFRDTLMSLLFPDFDL